MIGCLLAVLPQPVYMNMGDLAQMAAARARSSPAIIDEQEEDESPELKTPTAENQHAMIPGAATNQAVTVTKVLILTTIQYSEYIVYYPVTRGQWLYRHAATGEIKMDLRLSKPMTPNQMQFSPFSD